MTFLAATHTYTATLQAAYTALRASADAAWATYRAAERKGLIWARVSDEREVFMAFSAAMLAVSNELTRRELSELAA